MEASEEWMSHERVAKQREQEKRAHTDGSDGQGAWEERSLRYHYLERDNHGLVDGARIGDFHLHVMGWMAG